MNESRAYPLTGTDDWESTRDVVEEIEYQERAMATRVIQTWSGRRELVSTLPPDGVLR